jgi:YHS domain-containing protein
MGSLISLLLFVGFFYLMMKYGCGAHVHGGGCGHSGHQQHKTDEQTPSQSIAPLRTVTRDPACGMDIEISRASYSVEYGPKTYYFCSKDCLIKFRERPEYFAEIERMERRYIA